MEIFKKIKEQKVSKEELFKKYYDLKKKRDEVDKELKEVHTSLIDLVVIDGKSKTVNFEGKKFNFRQNFSTPKFTDLNKPFELFDFDTLMEWFKVEVKPKQLKGQIPEDVKTFYEEYLRTPEPTSITVKVEELEE